MKKWIILGIILVIIIVLLLVLLYLSRQEEYNKPIENIKSMHLSYSNGYMMNANTIYDLSCEDKCIVKIKPYLIPDNEAKEYEVSEDTMKSLEKLLSDYSVRKWDNFHKSDQYVLDGDSFSFSLYFNDGTSISASGYMMWPENYRSVRDGISTLFDSYIKEGDFNEQDY